MLQSERFEVRSGERAEGKSSDVIVRLLDGRSAQRVLVLDGGRARPPFAIGSRAAWCIEAAHLAEAHVMLAFNGTRLFACSVRGERALLGSTPLDGRWIEVPMPVELRFGGARLAIGRRAGPDDETQVPAHDEATRIEELQVRRLTPGTRSRREEEATCADEERLRAALALSMQEIEITRLAEVEPARAAVVRPVTPPFPRPSLRTIRMQVPSSAPAIALPPDVPELALPVARAPVASLPESACTWAAPEVSMSELEPCDAPASSMPPTIPSDGLMLAAAPLPAVHARPSSPTMAIPLPCPPPPPATQQPFVAAESGAQLPHAFDSMEAVEMGPSASAGALALAASGELDAYAPPGGAATPSARNDAASSLRDRKDVLVHAWRQTSGAKKAIAIMLVPALFAALLTMRTPAPVAVAAAPEHASAAPAAPAPLAPAPAARSTATESASTAASASAAPARGRATSLLGDTRTSERRAIDTLASGQDGAAEAEYAALAAARPENAAFREAARILRERASQPAQRN